MEKSLMKFLFFLMISLLAVSCCKDNEEVFQSKDAPIDNAFAGKAGVR